MLLTAIIVKVVAKIVIVMAKPRNHAAAAGWKVLSYLDGSAGLKFKRHGLAEELLLAYSSEG